MKPTYFGRATPGDFTTSPRVLLVLAMAVIAGAVASGAAWVLVRLIAFVTDIAFFGKLSTAYIPLATHKLGIFVVAVPVIGGFVIGLMARFGSEKIRGHGIPEALEAILIGGSRMSPLVAVLKPLSSAISIGTGGPFGAEGPIIMTGGALGSLFAQMFHMTSTERKTLLVSGAAAGMTAIFGTPVAAILLAVELLLFEWKPRSFIPVVAAAITAAVLRPLMFPAGPLFPFVAHYGFSSGILIGSLVVGLTAGLCSSLMTFMVYGFEDLFEKLPIHWMWWPTIGGVVVGVGGFICPEAMGVGYDSIRMLLSHPSSRSAVATLLAVKALIWAFALGSGTSGGVLAPLLIIGGSVGFLEGGYLSADTSYWALLCMAAMMGGTMRAPLTATLFAVELTGNSHLLLPLIVASSAAYTVTVLLLKRSILTEKLARRGHHISREYSIDPFTVTPVEEVMVRDVQTLGAAMPLEKVIRFLGATDQQRYKSYPVVDAKTKVLGMVSRGDILRWVRAGVDEKQPLSALITSRELLFGYPDELVGHLADRMVESNISRVPIVSREDGSLVGLVARKDLLSIRSKTLAAEEERSVFLLRRQPRS